MMRTIFDKVMWVGRATVFVVGSTVILALTVGIASAALAGTGVGATLDLGRANSVNAVTRLVGNVPAASLQIDNNSSGTRATALTLRVEPGTAPMKVDSGTKVTNLNSDRVDGKDSSAFAVGTNGKAKDAFNADFASFAGQAQVAQVSTDASNLDGKDSTDFLPVDTYTDTADAVTGQGGGTMLVFTAIPCDPGDKILNAGGGANQEDDMIEERPTGANSWLVRIRDNGSPTTSTAVANCLDFPPRH
ncbi:MAG TPA: hypothetical protein VFY59_04155 [Rubrobacter sp.]|nr:hypothetical protein [Rubrobacter sp.]